MDTVTIFIFFLVVLGGVFFGLFVGFGLIDFHEKHQEKKLMHKRKRRKKLQQKKAAKEKRKKQAANRLEAKKEKRNILEDRVPQKDSYTQFECESNGENTKEKVSRNRYTQDSKYTPIMEKISK